MQSQEQPGGTIADDPAVAHNAKLGGWMFLFYFIVYAGFILVATFKYEWLSHVIFAGLNLAIVYGMALILLAMVMAIVYVTLCKSDSRQ